MPAPTSSQTDFARYSLKEPERFWREQAEAIHWERPYDQVCDYSRPPFAKWFVGGLTNLCYNAVDRHLAGRGDQPAIEFLSSETGEERTLTYRDLYREVNRMAAVLRGFGIEKGDRVVFYLPVIPEAAVAMLACARLGIVHSVVFAGFAAESLARRIKDAEARLVITCDAGLRNGKIVPLKKNTDEALSLCGSDAKVLVIDRGIDRSAPFDPRRDVRFPEIAADFENKEIPCLWLESSEPSYVLYTSGTTARPKGVQRDTGGIAVALLASMKYIFATNPGETYFSTADIGWVVGHSYTVYGPLMHGMTTVMYEGLPICPDAGIWWRIVEKTRTSVMFTSPTAMRILRKHPADFFSSCDLSSLKHLFLAGEPLDEPTLRWVREMLPGVNIVDNYWQTETGWPILAQTPAFGPQRLKPGSPGRPLYGYDVFVADEHTGDPVPRGERGLLAIRGPLPPGFMTTVWKNDELFEHHYFRQFSGKLVYSTFDYAVEDEDGYIFILGRIDDVINVAGHRIGTREIEEALCTHPAVAEAAAVGAADEVKWQVVKCFVVLKNPEHYPTPEERDAVVAEISQAVVTELGSLARPAFVGVVKQLPKTRSGKVLRRAILAIAENRDPGDLSTLEDPLALDHIREAHALGK